MSVSENERVNVSRKFEGNMPTSEVEEVWGNRHGQDRPRASKCIGYVGLGRRRRKERKGGPVVALNWDDVAHVNVGEEGSGDPTRRRGQQ